MYNIGRNFHIIHMTDDLDVLDAWYDDVFSVTRWMEKGYSEHLARDASLVGIGDLCIEPMAPAFRQDDWEQKPIGRFYKRFGTQWHSIAWYVDDAEHLTDLYHSLVKADVEVLGLLGDHFDEEGLVQRPIFTHPKSTVTQLEFMVASPQMRDPRLHVSFRPTWWHDTHPLHIRKQSHVTLATQDLARARDVYADVIAGTVLHEGENEAMQTHSIFVAVGVDVVVELAQPLESGTPVGDFIDAHPHGGLFSVTLQVEDLSDAERYLASKQVTPRLRTGDTLLADPTTTYGANWAFTTVEIPNDARADW